MGKIGTPGPASCIDPPFDTEYKTVSDYSIGFVTPLEHQELIQAILDNNGIESTTPLNTWMFDIDSGVLHLSHYTKLLDGIDGNEAVDGSATRWINFRSTTYSRSAPIIPERKRRSVFDNNEIKEPQPFAEVKQAASDIVNAVITKLTLPVGSVIEQVRVSCASCENVRNTVLTKITQLTCHKLWVGESVPLLTKYSSTYTRNNCPL